MVWVTMQKARRGSASGQRARTGSLAFSSASIAERTCAGGSRFPEAAAFRYATACSTPPAGSLRADQPACSHNGSLHTTKLPCNVHLSPFWWRKRPESKGILCTIYLALGIYLCA